MANYYYQNPVTNSTGNNLTGPIITALIQSILGSPATGLAKGNTTPISTNLNADALFNSATAPDANNATGNLPKAYLTVVFFNERFEYVSEGSTALRVAASGDGQAPLVIPNVKAPKNGYAYVYLSNESNEPVYFDDFKVADTRGRIIEENHYYAYGLKIDGISSRKFDAGIEGSLKNNYQYQGDYAELDEDIEWHDFALRNYDAQTGRWVQQDPFGQFASPYSGMGNDPVNLIDPSGGIGIPCPGTSQLTIFFMKAGEAVMKGMDALGKISPWLNTSIDVARFGSGLYNNSVQFHMIDRQLRGNTTVQVGDGNPQSDPPSKNIPIFWEEEAYPQVEAVDLEYYETLAPPDQKVTMPPLKIVFLKFRYLEDADQANENRYNSGKDYVKPFEYDGKFIHRHEVPYASTMEGGGGDLPVLSKPVPAKQNIDHGNALKTFYKKNKLHRGDYFLVPLVIKGSAPPKFAPVPQPSPLRRPDYNPTPYLIPVLMGLSEEEILELAILLLL